MTCDVSPENDDHLDWQLRRPRRKKRVDEAVEVRKNRLYMPPVGRVWPPDWGCLSAAQNCRANFLHLEKKYAHLGVSELRRLRQLEEESTLLSAGVADLTR